MLLLLLLLLLQLLLLHAALAPCISALPTDHHHCAGTS
jgi:hypothetical protein